MHEEKEVVVVVVLVYRSVSYAPSLGPREQKADPESFNEWRESSVFLLKRLDLSKGRSGIMFCTSLGKPEDCNH